MTTRRLFFKLHNGFPEHPKTIELSDKAFRQLIETWLGATRKFTPKTRRELLRHGFINADDDLLENPMLQPGPLHPSRPPIDPALRSTVYERDGNRCVFCGVAKDLTLDHIYPWSLGGETRLDNLQTLCRSCNSRKGNRI